MIVSLILLWTLITALVTFVLNKGYAQFARIASVITLLAVIVYSVMTFASGYSAGQPFMSLESYQLSVNAGIYFSLGVSGFSDTLLVVSAVIIAASTFVSDPKYGKNLFALILLTELGMFGLLVSRDFLFFYAFWELVLIPVYFIIGKFGGERKDTVALKFFVYTHIASIFMLISIFTLYSYYYIDYGTFTLEISNLVTAPVLATIPPISQGLILFGFLFSFMVKLPSFPMHAWLPDTYDVAPYPGTIILAGALSTMGGYGLFGIVFPFAGVIGSVGAWIMAALGLISVSYFALTAMFQQSMKRMIAYASAASMGFVTIAFASAIMEAGDTNSLLSASGGMFQVATHGLIMLLLFASIFYISRRTGSARIPSLGGIYREAPMVSTLMLGGLLASLGLPGLAGFIGEFSILVGSFQFIGYWIFLLIFGMLITASYHIWAAQRALYGPYNENLGKIKDVSSGELALLLLVFIGILILGVFPGLFYGPIQTYAGVII